MKNIIFKIFICSCFSFSVFSNPKESSVEHGRVEISSNNNLMNIEQKTQKAIVNWKEFSIQEGEIIKINQPSSSSAILNRVIGSEVSKIFGRLESNGKFYLINENGILVGPKGIILTNGFVGSTVNFENEAFLKDQIHFTQAFSKIVNEGFINAQSGEVLLISKEIVNRGEIKADGKVNLITSKELLLIDEKENFGAIRLSKGNGIDSEINKKRLKSEIESNLDNLSALAINLSGSIEAKEVNLNSQDGKISVSGTIKACDQDTKKGGSVCLLAKEVSLEKSALIDISSENGEGEVLIGGDFQGKNGKISKNSDFVFVDNEAEIRADCLKEGNGGKVVLWAEKENKFLGNISAKGGKINGDGGLVEVSSRGELLFKGLVDCSSFNGKNGQLLLDPINLTITSPTKYMSAQPSFTPLLAGAQLDPKDFISILNSGTDVVISTSNDSSLESGNILVNSDIIWYGDAKLTLLADGSISIPSGITVSSTSLNPGAWTAIEFKAGPTLSGSAITIAGSVSTSQGGITMVGHGGSSLSDSGIFISGTIESIGEGSISLSGYGSGLKGNGIYCNSGDVLAGGNLYVYGVGSGEGVGIFVNSSMSHAFKGNDLLLQTDTISFSEITRLMGEGDLTIKPFNASTSIGIAGGAGTLNLSEKVIKSIQAGFSSITIGRIDGSADITIGGNTTDACIFNAPVTISGASSGHTSSYYLNLIGSLSTSFFGSSITLNVDAINMKEGARIEAASDGNIVIAPIDVNRTIGLGSGKGDLQLPSTFLGNLQVAGAGALVIGQISTGNHVIDINYGSSFSYPISIFGKEINVNNSLNAPSKAVNFTVAQASSGALNLNYPVVASSFIVKGLGSFDATFNINVQDQIANIYGSSAAANNTLARNSGNNQWDVLGDYQGSLNSTISFTNIQTLIGGEGEDSYNISGNIQSIKTTGGTNYLTLIKGHIASIDGNLGTNTYEVRGGTIDVLRASGNDELVGPAAGTVWMINSSNEGNLLGLINSFTGIKTLSANNGNDTFYVSGDIKVINMGGGTNFLTLSNGRVETINGDTGSNIFNILGGEVSLLDGSLGDNIYCLNGGIIKTLTGSGSDEIVGPAHGTVWKVTDTAGGNILGLVNNFSGINTLTANGGNDTFYVQNSINTINMGGGTNYLTLSNGNIAAINGDTGSNYFNFIGGSVNVLNGISAESIYYINGGQINSLTGSGSDEIVGPISGTTWTVTSSAAGNILGHVNSFTNIKTLSGNSGNDVFYVSASIDTINMGSGNNELYLMNGTIATINADEGKNSFNLNAGNVLLLNGSSGTNTYYLNGGKIASLLGSGSDEIVGPKGGSTWAVTSSSAGNVLGLIDSFTGIKTLSGNNGQNVFYVSASIDTINMGSGTNELFLTNGTINTINSNTGRNLFNLAFGKVQLLNGKEGANTYYLGETVIKNLIGSGKDEIVGPDTGAIWNITGSSAGNIVGHIDNFSGVRNLRCVQNDTLFINGDFESLSLGKGENYLTVNAGNINSIKGSTGTNVYSINGGHVSSLIGGSGRDTIIGPKSGGIFYVLSPLSGKLHFYVDNFTSINNLTGGGSDNFYVNEHMDEICLGSGANSLTINANGSIDRVTGGNGTNVYNVEGGTISYLIGGLGVDTIVGPSGEMNWNINGQKSGNLLPFVFNFSEIDILNASEGISNSNTFFFKEGDYTADLTINGAGSDNSLDFSSYSTAIDVNLQEGFASGVNVLFNNIQKIKGPSSQVNKLIGPNSKTVWTIDSLDSGNVDMPNPIVFSNFKNLVGGSSSNNFVFKSTGVITGNITGGSGLKNQLDYSTYGKDITIDLQMKKAPSVEGVIEKIQSVIGDKSFNNTIIGDNFINTWSITGLNKGIVEHSGAATNFTNFNNFIGSSGENGKSCFIFSDGASVSGKIDGGNFTGNTLDYHLYTTDVTIDIGKASSTGIYNAEPNGFTNFDNFIGAGKGSLLIGYNDTNNVWHITENNTGDIFGRITFSGFTNLKGAGGNDTFIFSNQAGISGRVEGDGVCTLDYTSWDPPAVVNLQTKETSNLGGSFMKSSFVVGNVIYVKISPTNFLAKEVLFDTEATLSLFDAIRSRVYLNPFYTINYNVFSPDLMQVFDPDIKETLQNNDSIEIGTKNKEHKIYFRWY